MNRLATVHACISVLMLAFGISGCSHSAVGGVGPSKLTLLKPGDQTIERGRSTKVFVHIDREDLQDPVSLEFEKLPPGVRVVDSDKNIPRGEESVAYTLEADPSATLVTNHRVLVVAKAGPDIQATETFAVTVRDHQPR